MAILLPMVGCAPDWKTEGSRDTHDVLARTPSERDPTLAEEDWFVDRAEETGLTFVHFNGATGRFFYPEILGPGVALLDYDNDGDLDVYVVQGRMLDDGPGVTEAEAPGGSPLPLSGRLFRNDLHVDGEGHRTVRFTDVTDQSGIRATRYGLGVATGDIDNDGWVDLYLTNFGPSQLLRNNGDGTFSDVTGRSGAGNEPGFGVSASFVDYDRDGRLDLYVGNNVEYTLDNERTCPNSAGVPDYCPPQVYGGQADRLYRNQGNGRFVDVSAKALRGAKFGPALGVSTADFSGDGWIDLYVANDGTENLLLINQRDGTFKDVALLAGAALNERGRPEASMGVDAGDFDNDGDEDLLMTHLTSEGHNLYVNSGSGTFQDRSATSGLGPSSLPYTGWGTAWFDFDNDGWLDILAVNGTVVAVEGSAQPFPYDQPKSLWRNRHGGQFENVTQRAGAVFQLSEAGRGAAFGDIDNDGDTDVVVGNNAGPVRLLVNNVGSRNHWLGLRLVGGPSAPRDMLGARVAVIRRDGATLWRRVRTDGSYASANDPRVLVGLGPSAEPVRVRAIWPGGRIEEWNDIPVDRYTTLREGSGRRVQEATDAAPTERVR